MKDLPISHDKAHDEAEDVGGKKRPLTIKIAFLDVGQGDTIVISSPDTDEAIVIDCIDADAVLDYLEQENVKYLRAVIVTHLHEDHYIQVDDLISRYHLVPGMQECENLAFAKILNRALSDRLTRDDDGHHESSDVFPATSTSKSRKRAKDLALQNMLDWCYIDKERYVDPARQGAKWQPFKGTLAEHLHIKHPYSVDLFKLETKGLNNTSVVCRIESSKASALLTGDLEPAGWELLKNSKFNLQSNVLKFPHHGGRWDALATASLLDKVQPSTVVISVGTEGEKYKHPNKDVFDTLSSPAYSHIRVLCTQATNQCLLSVRSQRDPIIHLLDRHNKSNFTKLIGSKKGCPCAGTIVIQLSDGVSILQPDVEFHRDNIVVPYFLDHKCGLF